ncbi:MAG TPA: energy transducer TonB [Terracidiphilus sp.]|jgi:protein TonB
MIASPSPVVDDVLAPQPGPESVTPSPAATGRPVREFQAICAKHSLACGAPEDLAPFLRALSENKLLAMNFWSVVARLGDDRHALDSQSSALDSQGILAAIVQGVTGQSIAQAAAANPSQQALVDQLARMLAGEDMMPPAAEGRTDASTQTRESQKVPPGDALGEPAAPAAEAAHSAPPAGAGAAPPAGAGAGARLVLEPELRLRPGVRPPFAAPERLRIDPEDDRPVSIPLAGYAGRDDRRSPLRRISAVVLTLAIAGGAAFFLARGFAAWQQPGNAAHEGFSSVARRSTSSFTRLDTAIHAGFASARAAWSGRSAIPSGHSAIPQPQTPSPGGYDTGSSASAVPPVAIGNPLSPAILRQAPARQPQSTSTSASLPESSNRHSFARRPTRAGSSRSRAIDADTEDSALQDRARIVVPGTLMKDRLVSSRFPIVPDAANADAVSGVVTLNAVVTARGTVEHIRAIGGPAPLRRPAIDAASAWRYRPYLLHGEPVNVSTTIAVNFSGND